MAVPRIITGTIVNAVRVKMTRNGNPRVALTIRDDYGSECVVLTEPDSSHVYKVLNETRDGTEPRDPNKRYRFHLNGRGNFGNLENLETI